MQGVVSVWTRWGDYVVGVRDVRPGQSFCVGSPARSLVWFRRGTPRVLLAKTPESPVNELLLVDGQTLALSVDGLDYTVTYSAVGGDAPFAARAVPRLLAALGIFTAVALLVLKLHGLAASLQPTQQQSPPVSRKTFEHVDGQA